MQSGGTQLVPSGRQPLWLPLPLLMPAAGSSPLCMPVTGPGSEVFQALLLRQRRSPASKRCRRGPLRDPGVTQALSTATREPLRTMHPGDTAPQGPGQGCQDTPPVKPPRFPGSWHLGKATEPKGSSAPRGRWRAGSSGWQAWWPGTFLHGPRELEQGTESLALRLRSSYGIHRKKRSSSLGGQAFQRSGQVPVSGEGRPRSIKGIRCRSPGFRGNHVWVQTLALHPMSLSVLICVMGTISNLLPHLHVKTVPGQRPPLTTVLGTGRRGVGGRRSKAKGWWSERKQGKQPSLARGSKCFQSPDRTEAVNSANPSFIGPVCSQ